jgi:transcriptional regulator with GAF, ATPase, and Fis domain/tetratricopeptide (TPR) repeat protein
VSGDSTSAIEDGASLPSGAVVQGRYTVVRRLGGGGAASAYAVVDELLGREVALKVLRPASRPAQVQVQEAFREEFTRLSGLYHPNLCQAYDYGAEPRDGGVLHFYTAELVEGEPLDRYARGRPWAAVERPFVGAVKALGFLHRGVGLRHGDFKPANVLVASATGRGVLADLGCAAALDAPPPPTLSGTPEYLSPELIAGEAAGARADLFAVGVTLRRVLDLTSDGGPEPVRDLARRLASERAEERPGDVQEVLELLGESLDPGPPGGRSPRVLGRERELERFDLLLEALLDGAEARRALLLHGPPGVGRSRLLREMKWRAQLRCAVVEGAASAGGGRGGGVMPLLRRALAVAEERGGDARTPVQPAGGGVASVLEGLDRLCAALSRSRPLVLVLDDVQELPEADGVLLEAVFRVIEPSAPLLLLCAGSRAPDVSAPGFEAVELGPLEERDLERWAAPLVQPRDVPVLARVTGGMPAAVEACLGRLASGELQEGELDRAGAAGPRACADRSGDLEPRSPGERRVLGLLAVCRGRLDVEAATGLGLDERALLRLQGEGLIGLRGGDWALAGISDSSAIVGALDASVVAALDEEVAGLLRARLAAAAGDEERSAATARLADHLLAAGDPALVAEGERLAVGERGRALAAPRGWASVAEALAARGRPPEARAAGAEIHLAAGRPERALAALEAMIGEAGGQGLPPPWDAWCERQAGVCCLRLGQPERARAHLERALALVLETDDAARAEAIDQLARLEIQRGDYSGALERALSALEGCALPSLRALLDEDIGVAASYLGRSELARRHLRAAKDHQAAAGRPRDQVRVLSYQAILDYREGDVEAAAAGYRAALEIAERHGLSDQVASAALNLGTACQQRGELGQALASYERGLRIATALGKTATEISLRFNLANLSAEIGLFHRAEVAITRTREAAGAAGLGYFEGATAGLAGDIALARGQTAAARQHFLRARDAFAAQDARREVSEQELRLAEVAIAEGDVAAAAARLDAAIRGGASAAADVSLRAALIRARLLLARGEGAEAASTLEDAQARARALGLRRIEAEVVATLARVFETQGARELARSHRRRARELWERMAASLPEALREPFWLHPERAHLTEPADDEVGPRAGLGTLKRFFEITARLNSSLAVDRVLEQALDAAIELTGAERGFVVLVSEEAREGLEVSVARNLDQERVGRSAQKFSRSIAEKVIESEEPLLAVDAQHDGRFSGTESVHAMRLKSVACVPIRSPGGVLGALYLDNRFERGRFKSFEVDLLQAFADQVAIALTNARLHQALEQRSRELEVEKGHVEELMRGQAREIDRLQGEVEARQRALELRYDYSAIVGRSAPMRAVLETLDRVIDSPLSVLIQGESGTGKELIARAVHFNSPRRSRRFVTVNCAALPETLLEVELFGCVRGAFTGADRDREGLFVAARGGTLFLDEVGEMPPLMQAKLLRVLQEREVVPVGSSQVVAVDVRVLCATNRRLVQEVAAGRFREDLYYRVAVVEITVPPLRDRVDDIPVLAEAILGRLVEQTGRGAKPRPELSQQALRALVRYHWPGNVRQLENVLARAMILAGSSERKLTVDDLDLPRAAPQGAGAGAGAAQDRKEFERDEARRILEALRTSRWNVAAVARRLAIPRNTLYRKLKRYGLLRPEE